MSRYLEYYDDSELPVYKMTSNYIRSGEINDLIDKYSGIVSLIIEEKKSNKDISSRGDELNNIKNQIEDAQVDFPLTRNVLKMSRFDDKRIGFGQDSNVYQFGLNSLYVYKEGKEGNPKNVEYLKNKYLILKKYLGDVIPKSYFVYGEGYSSFDTNRWLKDGSYIGEKALTVQRKVDGKDVSKMSFDERKNENFLYKLEESHKKYVLLKFFLGTVLKDLGFDKKTMDLQLDLGKLSNRDNFHHDDTNFIEKELKSPNIMWDGENVKFIDFGFGEWSDDKQIVFDNLMKEENYQKWLRILNSYGLN